MQIGVVGKPSSGKSTFFSAATLVDVAIANYPFTTIEPNRGTGFVRVECIEKEFGVKCNPRHGYCSNGTRFVPVELVDVAGLVPDAHLGKGKGNAFLDDLRQADALIHVVDASGSTNEKGEPVEAGSHDPCKDIEFLEKEIEFWFLGIIEKNWGKISKTPAEGKSRLVAIMAQALSGIGANEKNVEEALEKTGLVEKKLAQWSQDEKMVFATAMRQVSKPIVIAANKVDILTAGKNLQRLREKFPEKTIIPCSGFAELALKKAAKEGFLGYEPGSREFKKLKDLNEKQEKLLAMVKERVLGKYGSTGIQDALDKTVFEALGYIGVFPAGTKKLADSEGRILPDCILMPKGSTALDFAFRLHTDMGEGFIRAVDVKKNLMVGKDHQLKNRDAIEIVFKKP
ncbi:MAG: redox-regulated ATPase YchF [Candidatus Diapherotrites archaeon]|uniref:Redox-regulated ATPase YchF n=1 Tax=Candidatus Iainarchaeum sp. TaxID=3101447 RepID=A0A938YT22_9ARCH|nr:redox-regulated ATPase YchF [Candidatus Diapherotrites archaeon]